MSFLGKFFKLPKSKTRAYSEYYKVNREYNGILVCTMLVPNRPHMKKTSTFCDPTDFDGAEEISKEEYTEALLNTI